MQISKLEGKIPENLFSSLKETGIEKLNPVQEKAISAGLLDLKNSFVISAPTASGKTLIAELMMVKNILENKTKAIYIVPLRALASEKYESFKEKYSKLGLRVAISTGDLDSADSWLQDYDLIVLTSEKMDSLLRHKASWVFSVGVVVIDEVHLLNDSDRGPTLEITITKLRQLNSKINFLFLSATIKNAQDLASWIGGKLVQSEWRPVKLHEGIYDGTSVKFLEKEGFSADGGELGIAGQTAEIKKQALIFSSTRRSAEAIAEKCGKAVKPHLSPEERKKLFEISEKIEKTLDSPTKQCKRLAGCVKEGTAFHHAGLVAKQRKEIENAFKEKLIKIISSTPTLAAGVNLPAFRVVIRDSKRYYADYGYVYIPVLEYDQMRGRAGRPQFDKEGESILIAKDPREAKEMYEKFILGETEEIYSKLSAEPVLRTHALALIASELVKTEKELEDFFAQTFYGFQFPNEAALGERIEKILNELAEWKFIVRIGRELRPTRIGKRIAELYLDPETAHKFSSSLAQYNANTFGLLHLISSARELGQKLNVRQAEFPDYSDLLARKENELMALAVDEWDSEYEFFLSEIKTAAMFEGWLSELGENEMNEKFKISPGELHGKVDIADWLLYSCSELALLLGKKESMAEIRKLRTRLKYGIKEELLPLVRLKGIGRVRARRLWNAGMKTILSLKKAPQETLELILGEAVAADVKKQVEVEKEN